MLRHCQLKQLSQWSSPLPTELRYTVQSDKSFFHCTHQKGCGNPEGAPTKACRVQVLVCRVCQSLVLLSEGSRDNSCVRCDQVNDLLNLVAS